ncbi:hypothetical protein MPP7335_05178 [Mycolicibacterium parafortuitum]|uniref:Uncharacterized protein n=2 Tax=Mycolicibacterium parafortuitum TaxID=39692 RepID=A0A375YQW0_MYCPF|nr:hypothetical protein MPP7335_05178 [Mycolicibacterium parafortuitum]
MPTPVRIAAFVVALVVVFAAATWVGNAFGPDVVAPDAHSVSGEHPDGSHR